ncbi:hypothetical protein WJX79_003166 [Trebouxia sp. C0005]
MCQAEQDQLQKGNTVGQILFVGAPQAGKFGIWTPNIIPQQSVSAGNTESDPNAFEDFQSADEADLDQFDTMFGELRATRDRLQHLPRDQRQLAAADVALRIAAILGLNEESDDEESS